MIHHIDWVLCLWRDNGERYQRLEGRELAHETEVTQSYEKVQFGDENPAIRVQAVFSDFLFA